MHCCVPALKLPMPAADRLHSYRQTVVPMNRPQRLNTRSQLALQSYLDALLQDAASELEAAETTEAVPVMSSPATSAVGDAGLDDFAAAVLEEEVRDARRQPQPLAQVVPLAERMAAPLKSELGLPSLLPSLLPVAEPPVVVEAAPAVVELVVEPPAPVVAAAVEEAVPAASAPWVERPSWADESFECLLFDVAGLTLAVPLICLGTIYPLAGQELTPLFGQPDWFLGILPGQSGNLKVIDTARWVMPERYRDECREGLQYVISIEGCEWGLAVHQVSRSIRLDPREVKWRSQRTQRPWLAGTVIEHMCALLDVSALAELITASDRRKTKV